MLTTRSRKNGNSIVVTLPIFNGVKQEPDKEYIGLLSRRRLGRNAGRR